MTPTSPVVVPPFDPFGLPAPATLFLFLVVATSWLHALFMNFVLGGSLLAVLLEGLALAGRGAHGETVRTLWRVMPVALSLTITTGVAPLLFVQVLYGPLFYPANVFLGATWLALVPILMVAFYLVYVVNRAPPKRASEAGPAPVTGNGLSPGNGGRAGRLALGGLVATLVLCVAWILTNNHMLSLQPAEWGRDGTWRQNRVAVTPALTVPRYLHFVGGAVTIAGSWLIAIGQWRTLRGTGAPVANATLVRTGGRVVLVMTVAAALGGAALLLSLPEAARAAMFDPSRPLAVVWMLTLAAVGAQIVLAVMALRRPESNALWRGLAGLTALTLAGMFCGREQLRSALASAAPVGFEIARWPVRMQPSSLWLFAAVGLASAAAIVWLVASSVRARPASQDRGD